MNRLPGNDRATARSELAVFAVLGVAGLAMMALAAGTSNGSVSAGGGNGAAARHEHARPAIVTKPATPSPSFATNQTSSLRPSLTIRDFTRAIAPKEISSIGFPECCRRCC